MSMNEGDADLAKTADSAINLSPYAKALRLLVTLLRRLSPAIQLLLALVGLAIAISFGWKLRERLTQTQEIVANGLHANLETTSIPQKGIAAFLLSGLDTMLPRETEDLRGGRLEKTLTEIDQNLKDLRDHVATFNPDAALKSLQFEVKNPNEESAWKKMIVAKNSPNRFLMVPAISLRRSTLSATRLNDNELGGVLKQNPEILFDLYAARQLEPTLQKFDQGLSIGSQEVVQTYFITESGVISLHVRGVQDQTQYYSDEFDPYTLFMDRSYFWRPVNGSDSRAKPFDYVSEPYIDLGGNGLVITYSQRLELPNHRAAVICLDVKLPNTLVTEMERRLNTLGADFNYFNWRENAGGTVPDGFDWFESEFHREKGHSRFLGAIKMDPNFDPRKAEPDTLKFTIPLNSWAVGPQDRETHLLWVKVDFKKIQNGLTYDVAMFLFGVVLLVLLSWTMFLEYKVLGREMTAVLKKMTKVMREASTPFTWLDENNTFVDANHEFLRVLEYKNIEELKSEVPTFRALLTPASQNIYEKILEKSRQGRDTDKYEVNVITGKDRILRVLVHGERVPYPTFFKRTLPHRFGVFLRVIDPEELKKEPESTAPKQTVPLKALAAGRT